jgi:hypothetical protein
MRNRALSLCFLATIASFLPFLSNTGSSSSTVGGNGISMDTMIGNRKGFIYSVITPTYTDPNSPVVAAELTSIVSNIAKHKPRVFGLILHIDSYELRCLQEIEIRDGRFMRTNFGNFKQKVNAKPQEGQQVHIIAEKDLVIVPEVGTILGTVTGDVVYRLESVKELEDNFFVLTLKQI